MTYFKNNNVTNTINRTVIKQIINVRVYSKNKVMCFILIYL